MKVFVSTMLHHHRALPLFKKVLLMKATVVITNGKYSVTDVSQMIWILLIHASWNT
jgi:hypothetical protein